MSLDADVWTPPKVIPHHHSGPCACELTIIYIRVSKVGDRDPDSLKSPDIQYEEALADCVRKNKRAIAVLCDINRTGRTFRKRSVDQCIAMIEAGQAKSVTLWKWSRWGRNVEYSKAYLGKVRKVGGRVDSATEDFDQTKAIGRLTMGMVMQFDEFQSDLIGESWQAAHGQRRKHGLPHSGRKRFGYTYVTQQQVNQHDGWERCDACTLNRPHFLVHPVEGPKLAELYAAYVAGAGYESMANDLNASGFRTENGDRWTKQALSQMLDTGFGAGWIRERSDDVKAQQKATGKALRNSLSSFDVWRIGAHPTVITEETWQAYRAKREATAGLPRRSQKAVHALSALLFCERCARRMQTKHNGTPPRHNWVCTWRTAFHPDENVMISNSVIMDIVKEWVVANADPNAGAQHVDQVAERAFRSRDTSVRTAERVEADIAAARRALDKLIRMNARDAIDDDEFDINSAEIRGEIAGLDAELATLRSAQRGGRPDYKAFGQLAARWDDYVATDSGLLNPALRELIAFVIVSPAPGRGRWFDARERVEIVGRWEESSKQRWIEARRRRYSA